MVNRGATERKYFYVKTGVTPHCFLQKLMKIGNKNIVTTATIILLIYFYGKLKKWAQIIHSAFPPRTESQWEFCTLY